MYRALDRVSSVRPSGTGLDRTSLQGKPDGSQILQNLTIVNYCPSIVGLRVEEFGRDFTHRYVRHYCRRRKGVPRICVRGPRWMRGDRGTVLPTDTQR